MLIRISIQDTKLKKQDSLDLIKKLGAQKVNTGVLRSSKKLGRGGELTKRERLTQALTEEQLDINRDINQHILFEQGTSAESSSDVSETASRTGQSVEPIHEPGVHPSVKHTGSGSGLKRPLQLDEEGNPIIQPAKRHKPVKRRYVKYVSKSSPTNLKARSNVREEGRPGPLKQR